MHRLREAIDPAGRRNTTRPGSLLELGADVFISVALLGGRCWLILYTQSSRPDFLAFQVADSSEWHVELFARNSPPRKNRRERTHTARAHIHKEQELMLLSSAARNVGIGRCVVVWRLLRLWFPHWASSLPGAPVGVVGAPYEVRGSHLLYVCLGYWGGRSVSPHPCHCTFIWRNLLHTQACIN